MGGRFLDYMGQGEASARPLVADMATRIAPDALAVYLSQDTGIISFYDDSDPAWIDFDIAKLNHPKFQLLEDVDWTTPPTDNQLMRWDNVAGKFKPFTLPADATLTPEQVQDIVGAFITNGAGITVAYDDPGNSLVITCTVTQYTDAMANARADARIALALLDALADVETAGTYAPTHNQVLSWDNVAGKWRPRTLAGTLAGLTDVNMTVAPTNGQALVYDSATSKWKPGTVASGGGAGPSTPPTVRGTRANGANTASMTLALPAGTVAGDLLIMWAGGGYDTNLPAGWTRLWSGQPVSTSFLLASKVATAGDISTGSVTVTWTNGYWSSVVLASIQVGTFSKISEVEAAQITPGGNISFGTPPYAYDAGAIYLMGIIQRGNTNISSVSNTSQLEKNLFSDTIYYLGVYNGGDQSPLIGGIQIVLGTSTNFYYAGVKILGL